MRVSPEQLEELAKTQSRKKTEPTPDQDNELGVARAQARLAKLATKLSDTPLGSRNDTLNRAAYEMGRYVGADWIGRDEVERALHEVVEDWDNQRKTLDTLERALKDGEHNPASVEQLPGVRYAARDGGMYWLRKRDEAVRLSNFTAYITEDLKLDDGSGETRREYVIESSIGCGACP